MTIESRFPRTDPQFRDSPIHKETYYVNVRGRNQELSFAQALDFFERLKLGGRVLDRNDSDVISDILAELRAYRTQPGLTTEVIRSIDEAISLGEGLVENAVKDPSQMNIHELVAELKGIYILNDPRAQRLSQRFLDLIGTVKDIKLQSQYKVEVGLQAVAATGDPGKRDFGVLFDAIAPTLSDKGVGFLDLARGVFIDHPNPGTDASPAEMDKAPINTDLLALFDYAVKRINGKPEWGGLDRDPAGSAHDGDFSYKVLSEDRVTQFKEHLNAKFGHIPEEKRELAIKYTEQTAARSVGYVPWLMRETTRGHGTTLAYLKGKPFADELFAAAPFAADFYNRGRYGSNEPDQSAEDLLYMHPQTVRRVVEQTVKLTNGDHHKVDGSLELWQIVSDFREAVWGQIPQWVVDVRNMIESGELDLNGTWFPLPGEVVVNILNVEQEKRDILSLPESTQAEIDRKNRRKADFFNKYSKQGYGDKQDLSDFGIPQLSRIDLGQYMMAYKAMEKMITSFQVKPSEMNIEGAKHSFHSWMQDIIGKAKLIPGKHHLLFGPFTVRYVHRIAHSFEGRFDAFRVDEMRHDILHELDGASGLPNRVKEYTKLHVGGKKLPSTLVAGGMPIKSERYKQKLYLYQRRHRDDIGTKVAKALPWGFGKRDEHELPMRVVPPWTYKEIEKDTSK